MSASVLRCRKRSVGKCMLTLATAPAMATTRAPLFLVLGNRGIVTPWEKCSGCLAFAAPQGHRSHGSRLRFRGSWAHEWRRSFRQRPFAQCRSQWQCISMQGNSPNGIGPLPDISACSAFANCTAMRTMFRQKRRINQPGEAYRYDWENRTARTDRMAVFTAMTVPVGESSNSTDLTSPWHAVNEVHPHLVHPRQFICHKPATGSRQEFPYVRNDPVNYIDPDGRMAAPLDRQLLEPYTFTFWNFSEREGVITGVLLYSYTVFRDGTGGSADLSQIRTDFLNKVLGDKSKNIADRIGDENSDCWKRLQELINQVGVPSLSSPKDLIDHLNRATYDVMGDVWHL